MASDKTSRPFAELALSIFAAVLLCLTSVIGILAPEWVYPTMDQQISLVPNDIVNLLLGLPFLLAVIFLARRGRLWARLCWPGALLYIVYNSLVAVVSLFPGLLSLAHLVQLALCAAIFWFMGSRLNWAVMRNTDHAGKWEKPAGGVLTGMGAIFLVRAIALVFSGQEASFFNSVEFAVTLTDLILSPLWIFMGIALLRGKVYGRVGAAACLSQLIALFVGLMLVMHIQPLLTGASLVIGDFLVIVIMSLVVIIPAVLFIGSLENQLPSGIYK